MHRWWSTKQALVSEALFAAPETAWPTAYDGPLADDLRRFLVALVDYACRDDVRAGVVGLMSDVGPDIDPAAELPGLEEGLLHPLEESLRALVEAGIHKGEARSDIDVRLTLNTLRGAVIIHLLADLTPRDVIVDHLTDLTHRALRRR